MRCKTCDYRLWNIKGRHCPECSTTFTPSDYHFKPNAVEFCCPHCMHVYLGTDAHGHLEPIDFDCTNCGQHIHMNDMLLRPVNANEEARIASPPNPWTIRRNHNRVAAWLQTLYASHFQQSLLMDGTPTQGGISDALIFATSIIVIAALGGVGVIVLSMAIPDLLGSRVASSIHGLLYLSGSMVAGVLGLLLQTVIVHSLLKITGGTEHDLDCTFKAMAYTTGPLLWLATPCCSFMLFFPILLWYYVGSSLALVRMQQAHPARVMLSQLVLPVVLVVVLATRWTF